MRRECVTKCVKGHQSEHSVVCSLPVDDGTFSGGECFHGVVFPVGCQCRGDHARPRDRGDHLPVAEPFQLLLCRREQLGEIQVAKKQMQFS